MLNPIKIRMLQMVSEGVPYRAIAKQVNLSPKTVQNYLEIIRLDLEAKNTVHSVAIAIREGLIK